MENLTGQTVWITKYALTQGIFTGIVEGEQCSTDLINLKSHPYDYYYPGESAFFNEEDAKVKARVMRDKKVESLKKQIKKLVSMEF